MPTQVFAIEVGVIDGDVFHLPERVLGDNMGIVNLDVLAVLEDVQAVAI